MRCVHLKHPPNSQMMTLIQFSYIVSISSVISCTDHFNKSEGENTCQVALFPCNVRNNFDLIQFAFVLYTMRLYNISASLSPRTCSLPLFRISLSTSLFPSLPFSPSLFFSVNPVLVFSLPRRSSFSALRPIPWLIPIKATILRLFFYLWMIDDDEDLFVGYVGFSYIKVLYVANSTDYPFDTAINHCYYFMRIDSSCYRNLLWEIWKKIVASMLPNRNFRSPFSKNLRFIQFFFLIIVFVQIHPSCC